MGRLLLALLLALAPVSALAEEDLAVLVADRVRVEGTDRLMAEGAVEIIRGATRLRAQSLSYDRRGGRLVIEGPIVLVEDGGAVLLASAAELSDDLRNGVLRSVRLLLDEQVQLAADSVRRVDGRYTELRRTVVSSCQVCARRPVPLWEIRAGRVVHDQAERQLYFENAQLRVMGLPVFWLPQMRLPDPTVRRATGFLVPKVHTSSQLGTGVKVPYFLTFGPSRDLLVTPYLSPHTRTLELRYRQAFGRGRIGFHGAITHDDIVAGERRGYLFGEGEFRLPRGLRLSFAAELVSDPAYLLDYGYSGKDRLASFLRLDRVSRTGMFVARVIGFRTLRDDEIPVEDTLPHLMAQVRWERRLPGLWGGEGRLSFDLQGLQRGSGMDGAGRDMLRLGGEAGWSRGWIFGPGIEALAEGRITLDSYLVRQDGRWPDPFLRTSPAAGITLRWPWARAVRGGAVSVIEPVAQIAWSANWGDEPPNEDSLGPEFDEGNLLALDRFPGSDRREAGWRAVLGVNWTRTGNGWEAGISVGRVFRLRRDADFSDASGLAGSSSDWLLAGRLSREGRLALSGRLLLDDGGKISRSEARLDYAGPQFDLAMGYAFLVADASLGRPDDINEVTFDGSWRMTRHWTGSAGMRYDADLDRASTAALGLTYRNECVGVDLSLSRRFTSSTSVEPTTSLGLSVSLMGFGTDGRPYRRTCGG